MKTTLKVTCVGGGPGSELVGLLQACVEADRDEPLVVNLLDGEDGWAEKRFGRTPKVRSYAAVRVWRKR